MSKPFTTTIANGIAEMILDRPPVNAFDTAGWFAIAAEIDALGVNDEVRVIIIGAVGKGFCAGVDIKELAAHPSKIVEVNKGNYETFRAMHRNPRHHGITFCCYCCADKIAAIVPSIACTVRVEMYTYIHTYV